MSKHCEDCGCRVYGGLCVNCNEAAYIVDTQGEFLPENLTPEFQQQVAKDRRDQRKRLTAESEDRK